MLNVRVDGLMVFNRIASMDYTGPMSHGAGAGHHSPWFIKNILLVLLLHLMVNARTCESALLIKDTRESNLMEKQRSVRRDVVDDRLVLPSSTTPPSVLSTSGNGQQSKLKYHDVWYEINESAILNCSLRVNKDQHVVWHRKYDKMGVHVLTIGSETFISDLRIRPIKQHLMYNNHAQQSPIFYPVHSANSSGEVDSSQVANANNNSPNNNHHAAINTNMDDYKLTWNLEIRRLRKDDTAFYYCVLNSENAYGQIYKLNVLSHLKFVNQSEIILDEENNKPLMEDIEEKRPLKLICVYEDIIRNPKDQIKWYFNRHRIRNVHEEATLLNSQLKILNTNVDGNGAGGGSSSSGESMINRNSFIAHESVTSTSSHMSPNHHFSIVQTISYETNSTISVLYIHNFNLKYNFGRYKCQYRGLIKTVKIYPSLKNETANRLLYKQSIYSIASSSSSSTSSNSIQHASMLLVRFILFIILFTKFF